MTRMTIYRETPRSEIERIRVGAGWRSHGLEAGDRIPKNNVTFSKVIAKSAWPTTFSRKREKTHREYNWDTPANSFRSIQDRLGADEKLLCPAGELPRGDRSSIQMYRNRLSCGKGCFDGIFIDIDTWLRNRYSDANRGWFVAAIH